MENKDIDKAAREYSDKSNSPIPIVTDNAFRAGAEWMKTQMQSEIDELIEALEEMRWIPVSERLPEPETLVNVRHKEGQRIIVACMAHPGVWFDDLGTASYVPPPDYWRPIDTPNATQLLEKYGKKAESVKPKE